MKITKRLVAASAALTLALGGTAMAANVTVDVTQGGSGNASSTGTLTPGVNTNVSNQEFGAQGHTTVSIMEAGTKATQNISFEVPLYVTMAVIDNQSVVQVPNNYAITNKAQNGGQSIAVTQMYFEKLQNSSYNTVTASPATNKDIKLTIGGIVMPALSAAEKRAVKLTEAGSVFVDGGNPKKIEPQNKLDVTLAGEVTSEARTNTTAAAQFKVQYLISPVDNATGKPLGVVYAGDSSIDAGLGMWTTNGFVNTQP